MALTNTFKLEKLTIHVYSDDKRQGAPQDTFTAMFNPASFAMKHENVFAKFQGMNTSGRRAMYAHSRAKTLALELVLDGIGVSEPGAAHRVGHPPGASRNALSSSCAYVSTWMARCMSQSF